MTAHGVPRPAVGISNDEMRLGGQGPNRTNPSLYILGRVSRFLSRSNPRAPGPGRNQAGGREPMPRHGSLLGGQGP